MIASTVMNSNNQGQLANNDSSVFQYTAQNLPQEIKLFFEPKDER